MPVVSVHVSGRVVDASGRGVDGVGVNLVSPDSGVVGMLVGNFGVTQGGGAFSIVNVPSGSYTLNPARHLITIPKRLFCRSSSGLRM